MEPAVQRIEGRSLRRRIGRWIAVAFAGAIALLTVAAVAEERRLARAIGAATGESLLGHLAAMPEFRADRATARAHVSQIDATLRAAGIRLELAPPSVPPASSVVARREIALTDGAFELRYETDAPWLGRLMTRALTFHAVLGAIALAALLVGTESILRARLVEPLRRFAHQIRFMCAGGGWKPVLPPSDSELADLAHALEALGPSLDEQVQAWIEGERRASAARALSDVRARLRGPKRRALALIGDVQARGLVGPEAKPVFRALLREIDCIARAIDEEEHARFERDPNAATGAR